MTTASITHALTTRDAARLRHLDAEQALARARQAVTEAKADAEKCASEEAQWIRRHTKRVGDWIAAGSHGPRPVAAADAAALQRQLSAQANTQAAAAALTGFEVAERDARQELTSAEADLTRALDAALVAEGDAEAESILRDQAALDARRRRLQGLRSLVQPTRLVRKAAPAPGDWLHIPINELQGLAAPGEDLMHTPGPEQFQVSAAGVEYWRQQRAALLSGDGTSPEPASAAA